MQNIYLFDVFVHICYKITMKLSKKEIEARRQNLLTFIQENTDADIATIAEYLHTSVSTVRRDLIALKKHGILKDRWSGLFANMNDTQISIQDIENISMNNYLLRQAIAQKCLTFIEPRDIIFMNTSRTALLMYANLPDENLVIVTNNYLSVTRKMKPSNQLILTGGEVSVNEHNSGKIAMYGSYGEDVLNKISATKCILGVSGISNEGLSSSTLSDCSINKKMMEECIGTIIVLADHTKIGVSHNFQYAKLDDVDILITDSKSDKEELKRIEKAGVKVYVV